MWPRDHQKPKPGEPQWLEGKTVITREWFERVIREHIERNKDKYDGEPDIATIIDILSDNLESYWLRDIICEWIDDMTEANLKEEFRPRRPSL